jgi:hypothetical protein
MEPIVWTSRERGVGFQVMSYVYGGETISKAGSCRYETEMVKIRQNRT